MSRPPDPRQGRNGVCTMRRLLTLPANTLLLPRGQPCPPNPPPPPPLRHACPPSGRERQQEGLYAAVSRQWGGPWSPAHPLFPIKLRKASPRLWFGIAAWMHCGFWREWCRGPSPGGVPGLWHQAGLPRLGVGTFPGKLSGSL